MRRLKTFIIWFAIANLLINVAMVTMILLPRTMTRRLRHAIARSIMSLWGLGSRVLGMVHDDFWQRGNGV